MKVKCMVCKGLRTIYKLGCLRKECPNCKGTGFEPEDEAPTEIKEIKIKTKKGMPKFELAEGVSEES